MVPGRIYFDCSFCCCPVLACCFPSKKKKNSHFEALESESALYFVAECYINLLTECHALLQEQRINI